MRGRELFDFSDHCSLCQRKGHEPNESLVCVDCFNAAYPLLKEAADRLHEPPCGSASDNTSCLGCRIQNLLGEPS